MTISLPSGFTVRPPSSDDAPGVAELLIACDVADYGSSDATVEEVRDYWAAPRFDVQHDARIILAPDGLIVGYEEVYPRSEDLLEFDGYVHPREKGRGLGTWLLGWAEEHARQQMSQLPASSRVVLRGNTSSVDGAAAELFDAAGFARVRQFWRMEVELTAPPPLPSWPAGITVRAMQLEADELQVHVALEEAFADHWGRAPRSYEDWLQAVVHAHGFDPALTFIAFDGDEVAGVVVNRHRDIAWVSQLAVRRAWRHRGLGLALLLQAFHAFYARGDRCVGLGVDAQSLTGATRLYEKAGMRVTRQYDTYEKVLRDE